jgi:hypothetical protein
LNKEEGGAPILVASSENQALRRFETEIDTDSLAGVFLGQQDSFAGLFQRKDPREAGPILDIERALAKLEKVSTKLRSSSRSTSVFPPILTGY